MQSELHSNLIQTVYETELVYVYEDAETAGAKALFAYLSNCGAHRFRSWVEKCEYCGSVLEVRIRRHGDCWRCGKSKR